MALSRLWAGVSAWGDFSVLLSVSATWEDVSDTTGGHLAGAGQGMPHPTRVMGGRCPAPIHGCGGGKEQKPVLKREGLILSAVTGGEISPNCSFNPWGKS